jgi:hypothetical protein
MSRKGRRVALVVSTFLLLPLAAPAHGAGPVREVFTFEGTGAPFFSCGDFEILVDFEGRDVLTTWRDENGDITRLVLHSHGSGTIYPDNDPTNRNTGSGPLKGTVDFIDETVRLTGQEFRNVVRGEGRVAHDSGTRTWRIEVIDRQTGEFEIVGDTIHAGGPHPAFEDIPWCEIFA